MVKLLDILQMNAHILFPLKLGFSNICLVKVFRLHQRQPVSIRLINVDMTPEQPFVDLCLDGVWQYCLPRNVKSLISQEIRQNPRN